MRSFLNLEYFKKVATNEDCLVEDAKAMVSSIEYLVGIRDIFGESRGSLWSRIYSVIATVAFAGTFVYLGQFSQAMHLVEVYPDRLKTFQCFNCISATSVPLSKFIFMWASRDRLKKIFEMSRQCLSSLPKGSPARASMIQTLQKSWYLSWLVILNQVLVHFIYLVSPILFSIFGNERYLPNTPGSAYGVNSKESPYYETVFIITVLATSFSAINQTGYIVLFVTIIATEIGQFDAITETFKQTRDLIYDKNKTYSEKQNEVRQNLIFGIKSHQFLQRFHDEVGLLYKYIFGAHFLIMIIVIVTTLQTYYSWDLTNSVLTGLTGTLPLFLYCFGGELLIAASSTTNSAVYDCGWEMMDKKHARIVLFILRATQKPLLLTAAGIFAMNREMFAAIAQTIYKVCAVFDNN